MALVHEFDRLPRSRVLGLLGGCLAWPLCGDRAVRGKAHVMGPLLEAVARERPCRGGSAHLRLSEDPC